MIRYTTGNILQNGAEALVNTVNTVGIMGKGLALQFKNAYPDMFKAYAKACKNQEIQVGSVWVYRNLSLTSPQYIINFPTKKHWKERSKISYIAEGLTSLSKAIFTHKIQSIAIPPLGCGNGGLAWPRVKDLMDFFLSDLPLDITIYEPSNDIKYFRPSHAKPTLTSGKAAILDLMFQFQELGYELTWLSAQKLAYFLQVAGEPLGLRFEKGIYGPYADNLRHVFQNMEGYYTCGLYDGNDLSPFSRIEPLSAVYAEVQESIGNDDDHAARLQRVKELIYGYESPYGLELLATVHWTVNRDGQVKFSGIVEDIHHWTQRKAALMSPEHIQKAYRHLQALHWL